MSKETGGIATRDDVLTLGPVQDYTESSDGEPLTKCVPKFEIENIRHFTINGEYDSKQLLKFEDLRFKYIPEPEPEPEGETIGYEIHDSTPHWSASAIPVAGGSVTCYWTGHIWDTMHGYTFPDEYTFSIVNYEWEDPNKAFDVSISSDHIRITFSTTYNNTNRDQYSYRLKVFFQVSDSQFGTVYDWIWVDVPQAGLQYTYVLQNNRVVYSNGGNILLANGSNTCRIVTNLTKVTIKPDGTRQSGTTQTNFTLKPSYVYYDGDDIDHIICHTGDTASENYISAYDRGTTPGAQYQIREVYGWWTFNTVPAMTVRTFPDTFTIRQEANVYQRTETTTGYRNVTLMGGNLGLDSNDRYLITYKGTDESYYDTTGYYHSERTVIYPDMFSAIREYEYQSGYTARIESGIYESHGTASAYTIMDSVEVPSTYSSYAQTRTVHVYNSDTGFLVEPTDIDAKQPRLLINRNYSSSKNNFYVNVWKSGNEYEPNPMKAQCYLSQYEAAQTFVTPEIVSAGFARGEYPYQSITSLPFSASGQTSSAMVIVTADCRVKRYTIADGVTSPETVTQCTGRTSNTQTLQVTLNQMDSQGFVIDPWEPSTDSVYGETFYPETNEMLLRHYTSADHLAIRLHPTSANTTSYDKTTRWLVMYYADSNNYVTKEVQLIHEKDTSTPTITVSPTTIYQNTSIASSGTITVNASVSDWSCSSSTSSWLSAQKSNGNVSWSITAYDNPTSTSERTGTITVWASNDNGTASATVTVKQPPRHLFRLSQYGTTITFTDDNYTGGTLNLSSAETNFTLAIQSRRVTGQSGTYGYEILNVDYWDVYDGSGGPIAQEGTTHTLTGGTISTGGSGANVYYYVPLNIPMNLSTTSTKTTTVEVFQKATEVGFTTPNKLTVTVVQAVHAPPALTPYDYITNAGNWYPVGNNQYCFYFTNTHTSRSITIGNFWYSYSNGGGGTSYGNYPTVFTIAPGETYYATSVTFGLTNPYTFISDRTGEHAFQVSWAT